MRYLHFDAILRDMFTEELAPFGRVLGIEFIYRNHSDVYRVRSQRGNLIVHASADAKAYLKRMRGNLDFLAQLEDRRIPRILAWRASTAALPTREWAMLVYEEKPGREVSRHNFPAGAWEDLTECLSRVHALDGDSQPLEGPVFKGHDPFDFAAFASTLQLRIHDLPFPASRVQAHLDEMTEYVARNEPSFRVPPRLIHGDLDRKNIVALGSRVGILDWADLATGDYAFDLGMLKFMLDSVAPGEGPARVRGLARNYRLRFHDDSLELRLRFYLALAGLVHAFYASEDMGAFKPARAWRVRTSYLHSEAQWTGPLHLDREPAGAPAVKTEQWALDLGQPWRGLMYMVAPKRIS